MAITFDTRGPQADVAEVDAFEATLPKILPPDYRLFLLERNGGATDAWWPPEREGPDIATVTDFFSLGDVETWRSLTLMRQTYSDTLPGVFVPIASGEGGALVCLSLQDEDYGAIWFYDPGREFEPFEDPDPDLLRPLCPSFTALLDTLEPCPDHAEALRRIEAARSG